MTTSLALCGLLAACGPAPIYRTDNATVTATPSQVATSPTRFAGQEVVWGGRIVAVRNFPDHSEIELLGYPLDSSQRPQFDKDAGGRFLALMPGYVEGMDYPADAPMTLQGRIEGVREGKVGEAGYVFPLVRVQQSHRWTPEEMSKPHVSFGVGVGVVGGIH
ncbi:MAG: Slp family lipoprotein [Proteobacteria bacterium]|nr:Slp family lipoprotein [Pseudomonadota bacterium]